MTNITYPDGKWLAFTYDTAGRRASSLDQTGHLLTYDYDDAGRLQSMTNELGTNIVRYDLRHSRAAWRLKTLGNGVYTTYGYDAAGQLLNLTNFLADGTRSSPASITPTTAAAGAPRWIRTTASGPTITTTSAS